MDLRLGSIAVDWSLIEIWCCGKFHSNANISDHAELCHAKNKTSSHQIKYTTRRSCLFGRSFLHDMEETEVPESHEKSSEIRQIESGGFKRKEKESRDGDIEIKMQSPKRRHLSERKSKSNAEVGLASTSRVDSVTVSPNITELKNLYDDTDDFEGNRDTSSDGNALKKQKEEEIIISTITEERISQSPKSKANEDTISGVGKTRMVKNKNTVRQKRNTNYKKNEVRIKGETSLNIQEKIKIKKEKQNDTKNDKSMIDIVSDSDNESVMFLQSINTDFSCKVKNCLANFWFTSELDQHMVTVHKN